MRHIAADIELSYNRVYNAVKAFGIEIPKRTKYVYTEESRKAKSENIKAVLNRKYPDGRYGELASNWRGGITQIDYAIRKSKEYATWRLEVFKRDHFRCVQCNSTKNIEADHKKAFAKIIDEYNIRSLKDALLCGELWDVNNGETLCKRHHEETETHSARRKPILPEEDTRTEIEKQIDSLMRAKMYYQKRNSYLQKRHTEMKKEMKSLRRRLDSHARVIGYESVIPNTITKRVILLEKLLTDNGIAIPPMDEDQSVLINNA